MVEDLDEQEDTRISCSSPSHSIVAHGLFLTDDPFYKNMKRNQS